MSLTEILQGGIGRTESEMSAIQVLTSPFCVNGIDEFGAGVALAAWSREEAADIANRIRDAGGDVMWDKTEWVQRDDRQGRNDGAPF